MRSNAPTEMGGGNRAFPETMWTLVREAADRGDEKWRGAAEHLVKAYWKPIYHYVRAEWAKTNEEAKDLTQEFLTRALERGMLGQADRSIGSFRAYLKGAVRNFLLQEKRDGSRLKRGGGAIVFSLGPDDDVRYDGMTPEAVLDRQWAWELLMRASEALKASAPTERWKVYELYDVNPAGGRPPTYAELGATLGMTSTQVAEHLQAARQEIKRWLTAAVQEYVADDAAAEAEMRELFGS